MSEYQYPAAAPVRSLADALSVTQNGETTFESALPDSNLARLFGGQVIAQALAAAGHGVTDERPPHSLHAYFLRPGRVDTPVRYDVETLRDGRSFTSRVVTASQQGKPILTMSTSFHAHEPGMGHQIPMPDAPDPEGLRSVHDMYESEPAIYQEWPWVDLRRVPRAAGDSNTHMQVWMRTDEPGTPTALARACVLAALSDLSFLSVVLGAHGIDTLHTDHQIASLDHAMWFHRDTPADDWLLYDQTTPAASHGLGLAHGSIFTRDGLMVASVAQEGLVRPITSG